MLATTSTGSCWRGSSERAEALAAGGQGDPDQPRDPDADRSASDVGGGGRVPEGHEPRQPTRSSSIGCWPRLPTASTWREWLDIARYAESDGFLDDLHDRLLWPYRDWVIAAINKNMPFDQFATWQLAGDLLPSPHEGTTAGDCVPARWQANDRERRDRRGVPRRVCGRPGHDGRDGIPGDDGRLCALPRPQVRSDSDEGLLLADRVLQQHGRARILRAGTRRHHAGPDHALDRRGDRERSPQRRPSAKQVAYETARAAATRQALAADALLSNPSQLTQRVSRRRRATSRVTIRSRRPRRFPTTSTRHRGPQARLSPPPLAPESLARSVCGAATRPPVSGGSGAG